MTRMTGSRAFAEMMKGYGIDHIFFVPAVMSKALAEMEDMGIKRIMVHGEKTAAYMADGFARASGRVSVCMAQHIGASNLAAGLRDAYMAGSPVLALTGGPSTETRYRHTYQEIEDFSQFACVTKFSANVPTVARIPDMVRQAFREASTGAPGPVHLQFAVRGGHVSTATALIDAGVPVDEALPDGTTALLLAVINAHYELASVLLDRGANPNADGQGWTALHQIAWSRRHNAGFNLPGPVATGTQLLVGYGFSPTVPVTAGGTLVIEWLSPAAPGENADGRKLRDLWLHRRRLFSWTSLLQESIP